MTQADWNYPTQIHVGAGRRAELADYCLSLKIQRPLVVTDRMLLGLPLVQEVLAALSAAGLASGVFSEVNGNPTGSEVGAGCQA